MSDFEYDYYFNKYKNKSVVGHIKFKRKFNNENPLHSIDLDKLIVEIEKYQIKKYGNIKFSDYFVEEYDGDRERRKAWQREYSRMGTKKERKEREMNKKKVSNNER